MKSNFRFQIILLACMFALCSCEAVKDKLTANVDVGSFTIELDDIVVGDDGESKSAIVRLAEEVVLSPFSGQQVIRMDMLHLSVNIEEYLTRIEEVIIGSASITVTSTDENGTVVKNFLIKATDIPNFSVAHYELNTSYSEGVNEFAVKLLTKLFNGNSVTIAISGETDVVVGEKLKTTIALSDVVIKVKVLKE